MGETKAHIKAISILPKQDGIVIVDAEGNFGIPFIVAVFSFSVEEPNGETYDCVQVMGTDDIALMYGDGGCSLCYDKICGDDCLSIDGTLWQPAYNIVYPRLIGNAIRVKHECDNLNNSDVFSNYKKKMLDVFRTTKCKLDSGVLEAIQSAQSYSQLEARI